MAMYKQIVIPLVLLLQSGCGNPPSFSNFDECFDVKAAQYIDDGAAPLDGVDRAFGFCTVKYPPLEPLYVHSKPASIHFERLRDNRFKMILSESRDFVTFKVILTDGRVQLFNRVEPHDIDRTRIIFTVDGPLKTIEITEVLLNVNKGKHQGD